MLQIDDFLVAKRIPVFADFFQEMFAGHEKCAREKSGRLLLVLFAEAVGVNQAVRQFMRKRQPPPFQAKTDR